MAAELRRHTFARAPARSLQCLMRASAAADGRCLPCAVVSDSEWVERCARTVLDAPILTPGVAVHMLASDAARVRTAANVDKIFLDWWLLARSRVSVQLSGGAKGSSFFETAVRFKRASSRDGLVVKPNQTLLAAGDPAALDSCVAHPVADVVPARAPTARRASMRHAPTSHGATVHYP